MGKKIDISLYLGLKKFYLTIQKELDPKVTKSGNKIRILECKCDCGTIKDMQMQDVISGRIKSCGCYSRKLSKEKTTIRNIKHRMYGTSEYNSWQSMKKRCLNPNHKSYNNYGGRGINVCDSWKISFINFYNDMGLKTNKNDSLDRIDNNKGYFKENCRWASKKTQARNQRSNINITIEGVTKTISEWSEISGIKWNTIHYRAFVSNYKGKEILKPVK